MNHIDISSEFCDASGELIPLKELLGPLVLPTLDTRGVSKPFPFPITHFTIKNLLRQKTRH